MLGALHSNVFMMLWREVKGCHGFRVMKMKEMFLDLTRKMNKKFSIIPFLTGSLALQMLLDEEIRVGDIDMGLPHDYENPSGRWPDTLAFMLSEGFEYDYHEYFKRDGITINLCHNKHVWRSPF